MQIIIEVTVGSKPLSDTVAGILEGMLLIKPLNKCWVLKLVCNVVH